MAAQPPVDEAMLVVLRAWHDLDSSRVTSLHPIAGKHQILYTPVRGAIPHGEIVMWAAAEGLDDEGFRLVRTVIQRLDGERSARIESELRTRSKV